MTLIKSNLEYAIIFFLFSSVAKQIGKQIKLRWRWKFPRDLEIPWFFFKSSKRTEELGKRWGWLSTSWGVGGSTISLSSPPPLSPASSLSLLSLPLLFPLSLLFSLSLFSLSHYFLLTIERENLLICALKKYCFQSIMKLNVNQKDFLKK